MVGSESPSEMDVVMKNTVTKSDLIRVIPYLLMHVACFGVIWTGTSTFAVSVAVAAYLIRMFAITGFYHRYFSHRTFKTSRPVQFIFALIGSASAQRGPLWWAAHHHEHHAFSDTDRDPHSPRQGQFLWSHTLWFIAERNFPTKTKYVRDWAKFPELVFLDRYDYFVPVIMAFCLLVFGYYFGEEFGTSGPQLLIWGFFISTVALYHGTFSVNSLTHLFGTRPFMTRDNSRNNVFVALITLGEGWHNNHHFCPKSVKQGFRWWQFDLSYYVILVLKSVGLVWDLKTPSKKRIEASHA